MFRRGGMGGYGFRRAVPSLMEVSTSRLGPSGVPTAIRPNPCIDATQSGRLEVRTLRCKRSFVVQELAPTAGCYHRPVHGGCCDPRQGWVLYLYQLYAVCLLLDAAMSDDGPVAAWGAGRLPGKSVSLAVQPTFPPAVCTRCCCTDIPGGCVD